jgi:hypothetical protein
MKRAAAAVLLSILFGLQLWAVIRLATREPNNDEIETLHASWLMAKGEQLYVSFFEHHSPLLYATIQRVASDDVVAFFQRARLLSGAFGIAALLAFAILLWRVRPEAPVIAVGLVFASAMLWTLDFADARAEPFALAFFWVGAALVLLTRHAIAGGAGVALVAIAAMWSPKWPLCSLVVVAFWIAGMQRHRLVAIATAIALTAAALFVMSRIAPLDRTWFFMIDFNRAFARLTVASADVQSQFKGPFDYAPSLMRPLFVLIAFIIVALPLIRPSATFSPQAGRRATGWWPLAPLAGRGWRGAPGEGRFEERRIVFFFLALAAASLLELRFTFPYPILWPHYYAMWGLAAAALIALVPAALSPDAIRIAATIVALIVIAAYIVAAGPLDSPSPGPYWVSQRFLTRNLKPGETVWLYMQRHPIAVRDANYYWFNFGGTVPVARQLAGSRFLPRTDHLPLCAIARGARLSLRYIAERRHYPEDEARCFDRLLAAQRIRATAVPGVFEVVY